MSVSQRLPPNHKPVLPFSVPPVNKSTDYKNYFQGKWDCTADHPDELSFKRGEAIYILSKVRLGSPSSAPQLDRNTAVGLLWAAFNILQTFICPIKVSLEGRPAPWLGAGITFGFGAAFERRAVLQREPQPPTSPTSVSGPPAVCPTCFSALREQGGRFWR